MTKNWSVHQNNVNSYSAFITNVASLLVPVRPAVQISLLVEMSGQ